MNIRPLHAGATVAQIVALGREMTMESRYGRLGYEDEMAAMHATRMLSLDYIGFGAFTDSGDLVGFISGVCGAFLPWTRAIAARQQLLYITPPHRAPWLAAKLIKAFVDEAKRRGALDIVMENGTGYQPARVGKLFEICGGAPVGGLYAWEN